MHAHTHSHTYTRRVDVGGGTPRDAATMLLHQPLLWAALAGVALNALDLPLPRAVHAVSGALAPVHAPLALLAAGAVLGLQPPPRDVVRVHVCAWVCKAHTLRARMSCAHVWHVRHSHSRCWRRRGAGAAGAVGGAARGHAAAGHV